MRNKPLGCLTGTGIIATLITALAIVGAVFAQGGTLFSAGALNAQSGAMLGNVHSHAETGNNCDACHTAPWDSATMADRCETCHGDIVLQMQNVASLHGTLTKNDPKLGCRSCHPEHRGPTASLVELSGARFPHEAVGFALVGQHANLTCGQCHQSNNFKNAPTDCYSCHKQQDRHNGQFGTDCASCHTPDGWDRVSVDHSKFAFKLEGKHVNVSCEKCHQNGVFKGTPTDCYSCHQKDDRHNGQFGTDCAACHKPTNWDENTFDHNKSKFPLTGAHTSLDCKKCHQGTQFTGLSTDCVSCHAEPAAHMGQFGTDCASCHSTTAWKPAKFNGKHTFPLDHGESGLVSCATCHPSSYSTYTCYGCHEHNEAEIRSKHLEEGINNFQNCIECHADGRKHD